MLQKLKDRVDNFHKFYELGTVYDPLIIHVLGSYELELGLGHPLSTLGLGRTSTTKRWTYYQIRYYMT